MISSVPIDTQQVADYRSDGYIAPLDLVSADEAAEVLRKLEDAEARFPHELHAENRNNTHLILPFLADLAMNDRMVAMVSRLVGNDISLTSTVLFIKESGTQAFVSWHQDATYMGLEPDNFVTAWLALTPSTERSGCVAVVPGTHRRGQQDHQDTFEEDNILTRGQEVEEVDETNVVNLVLEPGQMSLHHPWLVHGSRANESDHRRVGIAFQSYIGGDVRPARGEHYVMDISGTRPHADFLDAPRPWGLCTPAGRGIREQANAALADVLYDGAEVRREY